MVAQDATRARPVVDIQRYDKFPPASRERELKKVADTFVSSGRNVFVHHVQAVLELRRTALLASGTTKKKYPKTAAQLWHGLEVAQRDERFCWSELVARCLRNSINKGEVSHGECLRHAGRRGEQAEYLWHAELAVSHYLGIPAPSPNSGTLAAPGSEHEDVVAKGNMTLVLEERQFEEPETGDETIFTAENDTELSNATMQLSLDGALDKDELRIGQINTSHDPANSDALLDTLPDRFEVEPRTLYSHLARYDFEQVRLAEAKHRTAMLRQLADLLDKTGKELFYYYLVPHLCQEYRPPRDGSTVTGKAGDVWRFLPGMQKNLWCSASNALKKQLGDGDVTGLDILLLGSSEPQVLRLHGMAEEAIQLHMQRRVTGKA
ncbi:hypothetical protein BAUCODRAFT_39604 [Baudoinia panamericana UAMH 10762]|uniref:Uncharacterized protein n=1 Tax=Baudoinia panamericana (strain UAMH 10762) TaxID=717646 RepID=M2M4B8_BAUPA|nr:uncharacterized protein BAUCODRAFT_39604 [Baudoinia panamericana UAMH 10762]EMC91431.1 hypothetical protein BAUCODRAFT_39604 [Baudoinia panamericana UAMH 10762]